MEVLLFNPLFFIPAGVALAMAICAIAVRLLWLIPRDEATRASYRRLRLGIVLAAAMLVLVVVAAVVILYLVIAFSGALPARA